MVESLQVIHTPGHTPGHIALYSERHRIIFGADFLLKSVLGIDGLFIPSQVAIDPQTAALSVRRTSYYSDIKIHLYWKMDTKLWRKVPFQLLITNAVIRCNVQDLLGEYLNEL